jgi:excisionase family DNA binding protein
MIFLDKRGKYRVITGKGIDAVRQQIRNKNGNMKAVRMPNGTFYDGYFNKEIPVLNDITEESYLKGKHKNAEKFIKEIEDMANDVKQEKEGKYMSVKEAAKSLSVSTATIKNKIKDGSLAAKKFGIKWCIERTLIEG